MASVDEVTTIASDPSGTGGAVTRTVTIASGGQWLFAVCWGYNNAFASGDVKDGANSWGAPTVAYANPSNSDRLAVFAKYFASSGSITVTLQPASVTYHCLHVIRATAKANAKLQATSGSHANSTSPTDTTSLTPPTQTAATIAIACLTHNSGNPTISAGSGYTLSAKQEDYGGAVQPGAGCYKVTSSNAAQTGAFSLTSSVEWSIATVLLSEPPAIYQVLGGSGNDGIVNNQTSNTITLPWTVPSGQGLILPISIYGTNFDPGGSATVLSDSPTGHSWSSSRKAYQSWNNVGADGSRDASVAQCAIVTTGSVSSITLTTSGVSETDVDAGHYWRWAAIVVEQPDTTNGFATATSANNAQANITAVAPGSVTPATTKTLTCMVFNDRGHATSLEPVTWSTNVDLYTYTGTENSAAQSGSWGFEDTTSTSTQSPTCTLAAQTVGARSCVMSYNLAGGSVVGGGSSSHLFGLLGVGS
jgi:hypothetical protein